MQDLSNSIAILPFFNGDADPDTDYLAEGISESITNNLSGIQSQRVIDRQSQHGRASDARYRYVGIEPAVPRSFLAT